MNKLTNRFRKKIPIHSRAWSVLTPRQKLFRKRSLEVLSESRKSKGSLSKIARKNEISPSAVIHNTNAFRKKRKRWIPRKFDRIPRMMIINENGKASSIEVNDSRIASKIGRYHSKIREFLNTGDNKKLSKFKNVKIKDSKGVVHTLETNPKQIIEISERVEEPEFPEIYRR